MRTAVLTGALVLVAAGYALAADPSAGRPGAVLDDAKCASVWNMTQRQGDAITEGEAAPFVVNFQLVDANADGQISEAEFKDGCKKGLVQEASAGGAQQPSGSTIKVNPPKAQ
jgi:hypothetical protein